MSKGGCAVVLGVGPGLGLALVKKFSECGLSVVAAARDIERLTTLLKRSAPLNVTAAVCDATDEASVARLFQSLPGDDLEIAVYNAGGYAKGSILDLKADQVERTLRIGALGAFYFGQSAAKAMIGRHRGTIIFTGATAALRGGNGFAAFAMSKFAARALSQSMARELGPKGIHVAHVNIDGQIGESDEGGKLRPEAIAEAYWALHRQDQSAWSQEIDLRPWVERF